MTSLITRSLRESKSAQKKAGEEPFQGERTYNLRGRNLNCGWFFDADFRRVDLSASSLIGSTFTRARFQGADLSGARLHGADLSDAQLQGANLSGADLHGANLSGTHLQGADLSDAHLQGANLSDAHLQGADLSGADLQGADFLNANLDHSVLVNVSIWRARNATCTNARVADLRTDNVVESSAFEPIPATPDAITKFIERSIAAIPDTDQKATAADRMRDGLIIDPAKDDTEAIAKAWSNCEKVETSTMPQEKFDEQRAAVLRDLVCSESENGKAMRWASFAIGFASMNHRYCRFNSPAACVARMVRSARRRMNLITPP